MLFNYQFPGLSFEIFLHIASILAVIIYFRRDLIEVISGFFNYFVNKNKENRTQFFLAIYIVIATGITAVLGILLKDFIGEGLKTPTVIAISLTVTGIFLIVIERFVTYGNRKEGEMTFLDSIFVGLGQTIAVFPGISRSGATLITALFIGLNRETAVRYSFLLSIPAILGSSVLAIGDFTGGELIAEIGLLSLIVSFIVTFIFSWIGIVWLIDFLKKNKLIYFALYCFAMALFVYFYLSPDTIMDI